MPDPAECEDRYGGERIRATVYTPFLPFLFPLLRTAFHPCILSSHQTHLSHTLSKSTILDNMRFTLSSFILLLCLAFVAIAAPVPEAAPEAAPEAEAAAGSSLEKRGYSGRATWYDAGLGSCGAHRLPYPPTHAPSLIEPNAHLTGWRNSGGEKVVALPSKCEYAPFR